MSETPVSSPKSDGTKPQTAGQNQSSAASANPTPLVLTQTVPYQVDGGNLLENLRREGLLPTMNGRPTDCVLLDSADIASKARLTSIAVLDATARLTCQGNQVTVDRLLPGQDGDATLNRLARDHAPYVTNRTDSQLILNFPTGDDQLEEQARLTQISNLAPLKTLAQATVPHEHLPLLAGVFAFDYLETFETLPAVPTGENTCPDYVFYDAATILVTDHPTQTSTLVGASYDHEYLRGRMSELAQALQNEAAGSTTGNEAAGASASAGLGTAGASASAGLGAAPASTSAKEIVATPTVGDTDFENQVRKLQGNIAAGDIYQVVPSRGYRIDCPDALAAYQQLREANPSPYMFYLGTSEFELFGASPESSLLHSAKTGHVTIHPIAGTRPRGLDQNGNVDHELDTRLELELRTDDKEVAEHVMLVDLARNDLARVCVPGTRQVTDLLRVDRYSRVMHLVSEVTGQLRPDVDPLDAFRASMTMGTLTGAPKLRAAELIRETEGERRGSYGGAVGYYRGDGELDTCIVIRSAFVKAGTALVQAGAGVVSASLPALEAAETTHKARATLEAIAASQGRTLRIATEAGTDADSPDGASKAHTTNTSEAAGTAQTGLKASPASASNPTPKEA
ncbi:anthranilate synthase component I [Boudabousia tangfeifanii]|uniref:anthranilate synthase n=1 Tax=Boudabousia tangfeifanii TaxID=1912795 RepID=A0A1D9MM28_9ACTO|nr:anthranilate synthase component 1 [Boudabousia tangfeifanii]AOZ73298.1 anthranilate synthase component I [Boudabousia tangfeifanii]